ncbi:hypothetical protein RF55_12675, partial [Lasius niger]
MTSTLTHVVKVIVLKYNNNNANNVGDNYNVDGNNDDSDDGDSTDVISPGDNVDGKVIVDSGIDDASFIIGIGIDSDHHVDIYTSVSGTGVNSGAGINSGTGVNSSAGVNSGTGAHRNDKVK